MKLACDVCGSPIEGTRELLPGSNWLYVAKWIKCARPICCALFRAVVGANAAEGGGVNSRVGAEEGTRRELARIRSRLPSARLRARHVLSAAACPLPSFSRTRTHAGVRSVISLANCTRTLCALRGRQRAHHGARRAPFGRDGGTLAVGHLAVDNDRVRLDDLAALGHPRGCGRVRSRLRPSHSDLGNAGNDVSWARHLAPTA
jgi:hypothetical protein